MQNNINNLTFKANIKPLVKIKNKSAFVEAKKIFTKATKEYPNDNIYITKNSVGETSLNLCNYIDNKFYPNHNICTRNFDKQINDMSADQFADKLIKIFKALKLQEEATIKLNTIKDEINRLNKILKFNKNTAKSLESDGKLFIANRYNVLAENNQGKIEQLKSEENKYKMEYNKKIEDLSNEYKEIIQLKK